MINCYFAGQFIVTFFTEIMSKLKLDNYRLTHSASELSGFACTSSLTMNEKFHC